MTQLATMNRVNDNGGYDLAETGGNGREAMVEVASSRAAQEVQAAMVVAKKFPRDETAAFNRVMRSCKRRSLAEQALYAYPKGGQTVTGPSIRLAEMLAQNWGNVDFGIIELEQRDGESTVMSYAWDLETNTRQTKIFTVRHERFTKKGSYALNDPREIYELTANQGARRLRACILGVIPGDVVDAAVTECEKTMAGNNAEPLIDRIRNMVAAFGELGVTQEMIEKRLAHRMDATAEAELAGLRKIYRSLKDGMADVASFFEAAQPERTDLDQKLDQARQQRQQQTRDPFGQPVTRPPTPSAEEAERIIQEKAAQARNSQAPHSSAVSRATSTTHRAGNAPVENASSDSRSELDEGQQGVTPAEGVGEVVMVNGMELPRTLPDNARTSETWINDIILSCKPESMAGKHARDKFHAAHKPSSWSKLPAATQDGYYAELIGGTFPWE